MRFSWVVMALALVACADDHYRLVKSPDGAHFWYDLTCAGSMSDCLDEAQLACKSAYEVVETNATGSIGVTVATHAGDRVLPPGRTSTNVEILVQCKREVVPPGSSRYADRVCARDSLMRTNMEEAVVCPPPASK
jgi:hypothetical protein